MKKPVGHTHQKYARTTDSPYKFSVLCIDIYIHSTNTVRSIYGGTNFRNGLVDDDGSGDTRRNERRFRKETALHMREKSHHHHYHHQPAAAAAALAAVRAWASKTRLQFHHNHFIASYLRELNRRCGLRTISTTMKMTTDPMYSMWMWIYVYISTYTFVSHFGQINFPKVLWVVNCVLFMRIAMGKFRCEVKARDYWYVCMCVLDMNNRWVFLCA